MRRPPVVRLLLALALALASAGGCAKHVTGIDVTNRTDRIVRVELLQLRPDGEVTVWSTQTLSPGGQFVHKVADEDLRPGMRARFMMADAQPDDLNRVMLNLPSAKDRIYDLVLIGDRLSARDLTREGKRPKN